MRSHSVPSDSALTSRLAALLADCDGDLSEAVLSEARSIGADASSAVVVALLDAEFASPTDDFRPLAAMCLATELRLAGTVPALVSCILRVDVGDELWEAALVALGAIGASAVEPLLVAFDARSELDARASLADALLATQATDERILAAFIRLLDQDAVEGASKLAEYGDRRALPALVEALDRAEFDPDGSRDFLANEDVLNLAGAIEALGGTLTNLQRAKEQRVLRNRERVFREAARLSAREIGQTHTPARREHRPGRNDPCHCGSGKKYKRCHLEADQRERATLIPSCTPHGISPTPKVPPG
jgi:SEC-C motif